MKALLHFGMHKTGSTAIQRTLRRAELGDAYYLEWISANHSSLFSTLFEAGAPHQAFRNKGIDPARQDELTDRFRGRITDRLAQGTDRLCILSAERGTNSKADTAALQACRDFFARYCDAIEVLLYVRTPVSFMHSAFQQRLKMGLPDFLNDEHWPDFQGQIEKIDRVFGRENTVLVPYRRETLHDGDVVLDFAQRAGLSLGPADVVKANESLSAEAQALLFVQRRFGCGARRDVEKPGKRNMAFVNSLRHIGSGRLAFSDALIDPIRARKQADLAWMEARLGVDLDDRPGAGSIVIGSEQDMVALALQTAGDHPELAAPSVEELAARLDALAYPEFAASGQP